MSISSCEACAIVVLAIHKHTEDVGPKIYVASTWILFDQKCPIYVSMGKGTMFYSSSWKMIYFASWTKLYF